MKRVISAVLIAPVFLYVIFTGGVALIAWLLVAFALSIHEWYGLTKKLNGQFIPVMVWGCVYMFISYSCFLALREVYSVNILFLFLGMIWFSDIGAYFIGKTYGGPKPKFIARISPNKTWSGFSGAIIFPALFAVIWSLVVVSHELFPNDTPWYMECFIAGSLGAIMGNVGQVGDLLVSFVKRKAQVKDTGTLIPGHGGLLDRIDSMLLGAPVFLILITLLSYVL
ncbi:MAG: phosphatidate cytidylyltransferase [Alphaproteobacteria bacterium]|nr:phosphatidate cytidylyltransferase [Alphaproteobacteria bacterium]